MSLIEFIIISNLSLLLEHTHLKKKKSCSISVCNLHDARILIKKKSNVTVENRRTSKPFNDDSHIVFTRVSL